MDQLQRLYTNFTSPYIGEAADDFVAALAHYESTYDPEIHYGHTIVIVQSSGTGKSRLVDEIGRQVGLNFTSHISGLRVSTIVGRFRV